MPTAPVVTALPVVEAPPRASQYLLADGPAFVRLEGTDGFGAIVNGLRVVENGRIARVATQETSPALQKATKLPRSLGGGFLFRSKNALFSSPSFDGPLKPVCGFMADIDDVSIGPSYVLAHLNDGDRIAIDPRNGQRAAISPPGLVEVGALDDGRVAALTTFGAALVSADGKQWTDVTAQLNGHPDAIDEVDGELWIHGTPLSARVEEGGKISLLDEEKKPTATTMRPRDPKWLDTVTPLRKAYRSGVLLEDGTALVVTQGALARIDVQTGAIVSMSPKKLAPDADCEGVRTPDDVVFICRRSSEAFVVSHGLSESGFAVEKTFTTSQGSIFVGDDGSMAIAGSCSGAVADMTVCVRGVSGAWQEHVVTPTTSDAGTATTPITIDRWIAKSDGNAIGLSLGGSPAMVDTSTNEVTLLLPDALNNIDSGSSKRSRYAGKRAYAGGWQIDRSWTATSTGIRGWVGKGTAIDIGFEGNVARSPYAFDQAATSGIYGFAITGEAAFQSTDRGQHWTEVAPPPQAHGVPALAIDDCGPLGCEIGGWLRVGWELVPPSPPQVAQDLLTAAKLPITTLPAISCAPTGPQRQKTVNKSWSSPNDLGFGALKLAIKEDDEPLREAGTYWLNLPQRPIDGSDGDAEPAMRLLATGYTVTTDDNGALKANGPIPAITLLRRQIGFLQAFDPGMAVRRTSIGMADYFAAARAVGLGGGVSTIADDPLTTQTVVPLLGPDPAAGNDLVASYNPIDQGGAFAVVRPNGTRVAIEKDKTNDTSFTFLSAAQLGDDVVVLQATEDATEQILRWTGPVLAPLFEVPAPPLASYYPANPDAIAIGPHGEIGVLRTPSGGEPPTKDDAALIYLPGQAPAALAPWSTLVLADDAACKADPGWRAIVTTTRPWLRAATADGELTPTQTIMRVKWSTTRVCLEALEAHLLETSKARVLNVNSPNDRPSVDQVTLSSWLVWKVLGNATSPAGASKGAVGAGAEISQPLKCNL